MVAKRQKPRRDGASEVTGLGIDAELSEAAHRGRPEASASAIASSDR